MVHVRLTATSVYFFANGDATVLTLNAAWTRLSLQITKVLSDTSMQLGDAVPEEYAGVSCASFFSRNHGVFVVSTTPARSS